jgi:hypothetical protein
MGKSGNGRLTGVQFLLCPDGARAFTHSGHNRHRMLPLAMVTLLAAAFGFNPLFLLADSGQFGIRFDRVASTVLGGAHGYEGFLVDNYYALLAVLHEQGSESLHGRPVRFRDQVQHDLQALNGIFRLPGFACGGYGR